MHWLASRMEELWGRYDGYTWLREHSDEDIRVAAAREREARNAFLGQLSELVREVAERHGVTAAFAEHEGLLVDVAGDGAAAEALAAMARALVAPAREAARTVGLGALHQVLLAGEERKLALLVVGEMSIGVLAPAHVRLADVLSR